MNGVNYIYLLQERVLSEEDFAALEMNEMPGFKISWNYNIGVVPDKCFYNPVNKKCSNYEKYTKNYIR